MADPDKPTHVYLIDGSGYIFRAFHALPPMTRPDGTPVNAVYGFTNMLLKLVEDSDAEFIAVIFDAGRRSFRNDLYAAYKAQRPEPPHTTRKGTEQMPAIASSFVLVPKSGVRAYE